MLPIKRELQSYKSFYVLNKDLRKMTHGQINRQNSKQYPQNIIFSSLAMHH